MPATRIPAALPAQAGLFRSLLAGKRVLMVLDNAHDAGQVRPLLPGSPGCLAIVTSRDRLAGLVAREGAHPLTLDLLPAADARELLALSVPMRAGEMGASHAQAITSASFASGVVFCTVAGTILAMILAARAAGPARAFVRTTLILVAVSLVFPLAASHTATTTRLTLALGHLIAAAIVIPVLTLRLTQSRRHRNPAP